MPDGQFFIDNELRISCADAVELVTEFLDGAIGEGDEVEFRAHLDACEGCRVYLDQIDRTIRLASRTRATDVAVSPANFEELVAEIERRRTAPGSEPSAGPEL